MGPVNRAIARLIGLIVLWASVELLERVAFAAGAAEPAAAEPAAATADVDEDLADEPVPA